MIDPPNFFVDVRGQKIIIDIDVND